MILCVSFRLLERTSILDLKRVQCQMVKLLRHVLFDIRAGNSNLAKSLDEKVTMQCTKMKTHADACYPCKINKTNPFSPVLVTSVHKTASF